MEYLNSAYQVYSTEFKRFSMNAIGASRTRSDIVRNAMVNGWRSPSDYSCSATEIEPWKGILEYHFVYDNEYRRLRGASIELQAGPINHDRTLPTHLVARAEQKLIGKLKGMQLQLANDVLEAKQVLTLGKTQAMRPMAALETAVMALKKVALAYAAAKRGRWKQAARHLNVVPHKSTQKNFASQWLEYRYAWLPLLGMASDSYDLARTGFKLKTSFQTTVKEKFPRVGEWGPSLDGYGMSVDVKQSGFMLVKCRLDYEMDDRYVRERMAIGMDKNQLLSIGLEAIPFSFVVEWFLPLQNVIGAIGASNGLVFKGGSKTLVNKMKKTGTLRMGGTTVAAKRATIASAVISASFFDMRRQVYTSTPIPGVYLKNPFSVTHLLDAMSLIRQLIK